MRGLRELHQNVREFRRRLMQQVRVLVVDDEEVICMLLRELLELEGYQVDTVGSTEEARERIGTVHYDLVIADKNLPNESGMQLIRELHDGNSSVRSVLITGYPSPETISAALDSGAADYIPKPFGDLEHLLARLKLVIHSRLSSLHFGFVARELKVLLAAGGIDANSKAQLGQAMLAAQRSLNQRLKLLVIDADDIREVLTSAGLEFESIDHDQLAGTAHQPLVFAVHLKDSGQLHTIHELRQADPSCEVLALAKRAALELSLDAVRWGASDYVQLGEGKDVLRRRLGLAIERAQRRQRNLSLVTSLCLVARDREIEDWEDLLLGLVEIDRNYVLEALGVEVPTDVESTAASSLDDMLADLTQNELRRSRRFPWDQDVWVVCDSQKVTEAFTMIARGGDISQDGMFIQGAPIPLGAVVLVQLPAGKGERVDLALGRVVRQQDEGVGIEFLRTTEQVKHVVSRLRESVEPA